MRPKLVTQNLRVGRLLLEGMISLALMCLGSRSVGWFASIRIMHLDAGHGGRWYAIEFASGYLSSEYFIRIDMVSINYCLRPLSIAISLPCCCLIGDNTW